VPKTRGSRMVGADEFSELWRHPKNKQVIHETKY